MVDREKVDVEGELRANAADLRAHPEMWDSGEPSQLGKRCLLFKNTGSLLEPKRTMSMHTEDYLQRFLMRYLTERGISDTTRRHITEINSKRISLTAYNDTYVKGVDDVIVMLEKAAAEYDG